VRELILRDPALKPTNIVFMGMGEPLLNWDAVDATLTILNRAEGLGIGPGTSPSLPLGFCPTSRSLLSARSSSGWRYRCMHRPVRCAGS